ncbi:MAG: beta-L-arabinofuranosidase domain-containing protein [Thermoguttaceae bacterium]|jgi:hypothetical protein
MRLTLTAAAAILLGAHGLFAAEDDVQVLEEVAGGPSAALYPANRPPLVPSPLVKLPVGAITPRGWLRSQLEIERDGMTGHLAELSPWCKFAGNAWSDPQAKGHSGWEEMPYWLKGYGDLGYVLKDEKIIAQARRWIEALLATQQADGWFGPRELRKSLEGKADLWPNMLMLNVLQSYCEHSGDRRVVPFMTRYFRWQLQYPEADFMAGYWPKMRAGDNLESVYWVYNRTGEPWLLELAAKIHRCCAPWSAGVANWHGVNLSQGFREPGEYFIQSHERRFLDAAERNYQTVMGTYGQFPGGGFAADENCRPGYVDPRQGCETCTWVEFLHSFEMLTRISGNPTWADRCEEIAFNSLPAALTPDEKGLHYLTGANMVQLDRGNKAPGFENGGTMLSYSPGAVYRCCQHNVSHGWPYYAEELWLATADGGLCASLYAASEVTANVADGPTVTISETTDYPFSETIRLELSMSEPEQFPLYLRIPRWCPKPAVAVNGAALAVAGKPASYLRISRRWTAGDVLTLRLPMTLGVRRWVKNKDAVSVAFGPLWFSLKIGERWQRCGGSEQWPDYEVFPTTPWNYGLVLDEHLATRGLELARGLSQVSSACPSGQAETGTVPFRRLARQPFTPDAVPLRVTAKARKIPGWTLDRRGLINVLQPSPVRSAEPLETVTLIPMGAARLRITAFPQIGQGAEAHDWPVPAAPAFTASASHCWDSDTIDALSDGILPARSGDQGVPRFTWWDHRGTTEWVQYDFPKPREVSAVEVYWFDDTGHGECRVPASWKLLAKQGQAWKPVEEAAGYGTELDRFNRTTFRPITAAGLRIVVELKPNFSGGILEWRVGP